MGICSTLTPRWTKNAYVSPYVCEAFLVLIVVICPPANNSYGQTEMIEKWDSTVYTPRLKLHIIDGHSTYTRYIASTTTTSALLQPGATNYGCSGLLAAFVLISSGWILQAVAKSCNERAGALRSGPPSKSPSSPTLCKKKCTRLPGATECERRWMTTDKLEGVFH